MTKRGADEPVGLDELLSTSPSAGVTGLGGELIEDSPHRPIVGARDDLCDLWVS